MFKYIALVLPLFCFYSLKSQEISSSLTRDTAFIYKGQSKSALYFGTDIRQKAFIEQWKLFLKEKLNTSLKIDSKSKSEISYISKEINSLSFFGGTPSTLHVRYINIHKDSLVWILFPKEDGSLEKWRSLANQFLVDKLPLLYNNEFDLLKKDVHFLEKELDSYRNKLISNRKLITKLEKENFSLEGLILEEEDSLREMIKKWSDKMKKWEKLRAVP
jgi:hypothetical protein